jgi:hypothetical protein
MIRFNSFFVHLIALVGFASSINGQGIIHFSNIPPVPNAPIFDVDCTTPLAGAAYQAQLYAGPQNAPEGALVPVGPSVSFITGDGAGFFMGGNREIPGVPVGQTAALQVRVWESNWATYEESVAEGGLFGKSDILNLPLGGPLTSVQQLHGLESFCLVPEPSTWGLGLLGLLMLFWKRLRGGA